MRVRYIVNRKKSKLSGRKQARRLFLRRRDLLNGAGVVTVLVVGGGVWRAYDQGGLRVGEGPAYTTMKDWRREANDWPLDMEPTGMHASRPQTTQPAPL